MSNNHQPLFSDEELLTIYMFEHPQGRTPERRINDYIRNHWREWFLALPACRAFNRRLNEPAPAFELLVENLLTNIHRQTQPTDDRLINSMPVVSLITRQPRTRRTRVARFKERIYRTPPGVLLSQGLKVHC